MKNAKRNSLLWEINDLLAKIFAEVTKRNRSVFVANLTFVDASRCKRSMKNIIVRYSLCV